MTELQQYLSSMDTHVSERKCPYMTGVPSSQVLYNMTKCPLGAGCPLKTGFTVSADRPYVSPVRMYVYYVRTGDTMV